MESHDDLMQESMNNLTAADNATDHDSALMFLATAMSFAGSALHAALTPVERMNACSQMSEIHLIKGDYDSALRYADQMHLYCPGDPFGYMQKFRVRSLNRERIFNDGPSQEPSQGIRTGLNIRARARMAYLGLCMDNEAKALMDSVKNHLIEKQAECVYALHYMIKPGAEHLKNAGKNDTARQICILVLRSPWRSSELNEDAQATLDWIKRAAEGMMMMG